MKLSEIYEGWRNRLIPPADMKDKIEAVSASRMEICQECRFYSENRKRKEGYKSRRPDLHCTHCGCTLSAKTRCLSCSCPVNHWKALMTDDQYDEIRNELGDGERQQVDNQEGTA